MPISTRIFETFQRLETSMPWDAGHAYWPLTYARLQSSRLATFQAPNIHPWHIVYRLKCPHSWDMYHWHLILFPENGWEGLISLWFFPEYTIETNITRDRHALWLIQQVPVLPLTFRCLSFSNMAGYSAHPQLDEQSSLGRHVRPQYVYRALRTDELLGNNSVRLEARGRVLPATPDTIKMAVEKGWGPSPFIHTTTSPTAALWFACSIKAQKKSGKIAKFDLKKFKGNVYDLSSQNRFLVPFSKADNFARCFSEVLLQGPHDFGSNRLWNGILTEAEEQISVVQIWDVSNVRVPDSKTFRAFEAELPQFSSDTLQRILGDVERPNYTGGADFGRNPFRNLLQNPSMPETVPPLDADPLFPVNQSHLLMPGHLEMATRWCWGHITRSPTKQREQF